MAGKPGLLREPGKRTGERGPETARSCIRRAPYPSAPLRYRDAVSAGPFLPTPRESEVGDWRPERVEGAAASATVHLPVPSARGAPARPLPLHHPRELAVLAVPEGGRTP